MVLACLMLTEIKHDRSQSILFLEDTLKFSKRLSLARNVNDHKLD